MPKAYRIFWTVMALGWLLGGPALSWAQEPADAGEAGFYYTIQKGDTLWDLSQKFYQSQWDWPGLWEMNKEIKNPHQLEPGQKIRVFLKSDPQGIDAQKPLASQPDPITPFFEYSAMDQVGFIRKTEQNSLGTIIREQDGNFLISTDDIIYIEPAGVGALAPGQEYQIFNVETVNEKLGSSRYKGIKHRIKAVIQVLEIKTDYAVARVTESFQDAAVGDKIMTLTRRDAKIEIEKSPAPIDAFIVCSEDRTVMVNDFSIAFINKGAQDNIRPGQIYAIHQNQENRSVFDTKAVSSLEPLFSGRLIVLHAEDISATVMILSSKRDIHPGDMVN